MRNLLLLQKCLFLFLITGILSCERPPTFPKEPRIEFKEAKHNFTTENGALIDKLVLTIRFEDGNGDLGLTDAEVNNPPYNQNNNNTNYFIDIFIKKDGVYELLNLPFSFSGRFPPLAPDGRTGPLEGDLKYTITLDERSVSSLIKKGDYLKFRIKIRDKALNESNLVESGEVLMFTP